MALVRLLKVAVIPLPRLAVRATLGSRLQVTSLRPLWRGLLTARPLLQAADKAAKTKVAPRELRRLLTLAKPERWKLGGRYSHDECTGLVAYMGETATRSIYEI